MLKGSARQEYERDRNLTSDESRRGSGKALVVRLRKGERERVRLRLVSDSESARPRRRSDCIDGPRPCPWVSCRHHLYLEVNDGTGTMKVYHPETEPDELERSCSLDIADEGGTSLADIAVMLNVTRERARQIEDDAMRKLLPLLEGWNPNEDE